MKAYGVTIQDLGRDCTAVAKYGSSKLVTKCSCGKRKCVRGRDRRQRKAKMRRKFISAD